MLRDMEELLNSVCDDGIRKYLNEALGCYNSKSYRACVIMAVIAGSFDLHRKVKELASSNPVFRELDNTVEKNMRESVVYEKFLIEQCATSEIDMLNDQEKKILLRCLEIRNDCAHPNKLICTAENARVVFSDIIDVLASKPVLFGCTHMKVIVEGMEESTFFPANLTEKMQTIVNEKLGILQRKAIPNFLKLLVETIKNTNSKQLRQNAICFLSLVANENSSTDKYEKVISDFIDKDKYENVLLELLKNNINILEVLSDTNIEKILSKFESYIPTPNFNIMDIWIEIILSDKLQKNEPFLNKIVEIIATVVVGNVPVKEFLLKILNNKKCTAEFIDNIINVIRCKKFGIEDFEGGYLSKIIDKLDVPQLYENWLVCISTAVNNCDFAIQNNAIKMFKMIPKDKWIDQISTETKFKFIKSVLYQSTEDRYKSYGCEELKYKLCDNYLELVISFLEFIFINEDLKVVEKNINNYIKFEYEDTVMSYILKCKELTEKIKKNLISIDKNKYKSWIDKISFYEMKMRKLSEKSQL